ncbi:hypothetical protein V1523DRAFT_436172 [Lipomyces doorenjongii]
MPDAIHAQGCHVIIGDIWLVEESESLVTVYQGRTHESTVSKDRCDQLGRPESFDRAHQEFGKTPDLYVLQNIRIACSLSVLVGAIIYVPAQQRESSAERGRPWFAWPQQSSIGSQDTRTDYTFKLVSLMFVKDLCKNPGIVELLFKANLPATIAKLAACNLLTGKAVASGRPYLDRMTSGVEWFSATFARKLQRLVLVFDNSVLYSKIIVDRVRIHKDYANA